VGVFVGASAVGLWTNRRAAACLVLIGSSGDHVGGGSARELSGMARGAAWFFHTQYGQTMRRAFDVSAVRFAESETMKTVPAAELMLRAARGLENVCVEMLMLDRGRVSGARVVLLVGSGNNGGDTLFAGRELATRGAWVLALNTSPDIHEAGARAVIAAGGRVAGVADSEADLAEAVSAVRRADLVLDGIVGIGGRGAVREPAATLVRAIETPRTIRVAVDTPSGVDPDSGEIGDPEAVFRADVTVTFGCLKSGLVLPPGSDAAGVVELIDIGLEPQLASLPDVKLLQFADVGPFLQAPSYDDYKYSHGVVGVVAGSAEFQGAAHLVAGAARHAGVGMVRVADRGDGVAQSVVHRFPDVVVADGSDLDHDPRATAWAIGPGAGTDSTTADNITTLLGTELPVVLDADAITIVANNEDLWELIRHRSAATVITPHMGEFERLGFDLDGGRIKAARYAADSLQAVIVLKGPGTVIAGPGNKVFVDPIGPPDLATAGTGDVLTGLIAGVLAQEFSPPNQVVRAVAAAVYLHGQSARKATAGGRPMTSWDLVCAVPQAVADFRS
jgi:hydroxyethylthiazole kinase-like uncharacterized protein yjeF